MKLRKLIISALTICILLCCSVVSFADDVTTQALPSSDKAKVYNQDATLLAYKIDGNNYVRLRDFAMLVNGTPGNFDVTWDQDANMIGIATGTKYSNPNNETLAGKTLSPETKQAKPTTSALKVDKKVLTSGEAPKGYNIDDSNYFKLRDLCQLVGISVDWDNVNKTVELGDTGGKGSSGGQVTPATPAPTTPVNTDHPTAPYWDGVERHISNGLQANFSEMGPDGKSVIPYYVLPDGSRVISAGHPEFWREGDHLSMTGAIYTPESNGKDWQGVTVQS